MPNGFSNMRHDVLNYTPQNNQIACRLCNRVFGNTQTLITHIESHMEHEEAAIRRLYSPEHINPQRQFSSHCFPPGFPLPIDTSQNINDGRIFQQQPLGIPQPIRNPFLVGSRQIQLPPHVLSSSINNNNNNNVNGFLAQLANPHVYQWKQPEEESSNDGTKAYIMQLEKPIKKIDFIDLVHNDDDNNNNHNSNVQTLDLSLKL